MHFMMGLGNLDGNAGTSCEPEEAVSPAWSANKNLPIVNCELLPRLADPLRSGLQRMEASEPAMRVSPPRANRLAGLK